MQIVLSPPTPSLIDPPPSQPEAISPAAVPAMPSHLPVITHLHARPGAVLMRKADNLPSGLPLVFGIRDGAYFYDGKKILEDIASGRGAGLNNPDDTKKMEGPVPLGPYLLGAMTSAPAVNSKGKNIGGLLGNKRIHLIPLFKTIRDSLEAHSREGEPISKGSHGCITTPDQNAQNKLVAFIQAYHIKKLQVVASFTPAPQPVAAQVKQTPASSPSSISAPAVPPSTNPFSNLLPVTSFKSTPPSP